MNVSGSNAGFFAFLVAVVGIATAIFWMVVGWRAMRAHERLAEATERIARNDVNPNTAPPTM
jgi:uncharacterized membrane protein